MTAKVKVGGMPARRSAQAVVDWTRVANELKKTPGEPVLLPEFKGVENVMSIVNSVNRDARAPRALRDLGGKVKAQMRSTISLPGRRRRGDVWLIWHPPVE